jgi:hypothetical protein
MMSNLAWQSSTWLYTLASASNSAFSCRVLPCTTRRGFRLGTKYQDVKIIQGLSQLTYVPLGIVQQATEYLFYN